MALVEGGLTITVGNASSLRSMPLILLDSERPSWSGFRCLFPKLGSAFSSRVTFTFSFFFPRTSGCVPASLKASPSLFISRSLRRERGRRPVWAMSLFADAVDLRRKVLAFGTIGFSAGGRSIVGGVVRSTAITGSAGLSSDLRYTILGQRELVVCVFVASWYFLLYGWLFSVSQGVLWATGSNALSASASNRVTVEAAEGGMSVASEVLALFARSGISTRRWLLRVDIERPKDAPVVGTCRCTWL